MSTCQTERGRISSIVGVVLAGGQSSRMGRDKALLEFGGHPFIAVISGELRSVFERVAVISDFPERFSFLDLPVYPDLLKHKGPLGGIHAAFMHTGADELFVVSCDVPMITSDIMRRLLAHRSDADVLVARSADRVQPLCGLYRRTCLPVIEDHLARNVNSVLQLLSAVSTEAVRVDQDTLHGGLDPLRNVNTPAAYQELMREYRANVDADAFGSMASTIRSPFGNYR